MARGGEQPGQLCSSSLTQGPKVTLRVSKDVAEFPDMESVMITLEYPPSGSDVVHRHNTYAPLYRLEGSVVMKVHLPTPLIQPMAGDDVARAVGRVATGSIALAKKPAAAGTKRLTADN